MVGVDSRFNGREVLKESNVVIEAIYRIVIEQRNTEIPPAPPLKREEIMGKTCKLALMPLRGRASAVSLRPELRPRAPFGLSSGSKTAERSGWGARGTGGEIL